TLPPSRRRMSSIFLNACSNMMVAFRKAALKQTGLQVDHRMECPDDDKGVGRPEVPLACGSQKEVEVVLIAREGVQVFLPHILTCLWQIPEFLESAPKESPGFPVFDHQFVALPAFRFKRISEFHG